MPQRFWPCFDRSTRVRRQHIHRESHRPAGDSFSHRLPEVSGYDPLSFFNPIATMLRSQQVIFTQGKTRLWGADPEELHACSPITTTSHSVFHPHSLVAQGRMSSLFRFHGTTEPQLVVLNPSPNADRFGLLWRFPSG